MFKDYNQVIAQYRQHGLEEKAQEIERAILRWIEVVQEITDGLEEATLNTKIDKRNTEIKILQEEFEKVKLPSIEQLRDDLERLKMAPKKDSGAE